MEMMPKQFLGDYPNILDMFNFVTETFRVVKYEKDKPVFMFRNVEGIISVEITDWVWKIGNGKYVKISNKEYLGLLER